MHPASLPRNCLGPCTRLRINLDEFVISQSAFYLQAYSFAEALAGYGDNGFQFVANGPELFGVSFTHLRFGFHAGAVF